MTVTPAIIEDFVQYAVSKDIAPLPDIREALAKADDRNYIERALKAEIVAAMLGYDASYPYRLQGDTQVEKALEVFPQAQKLAAVAADARAKSGEPGATDAGTRAAAALPKTR
jgi:hypothetical protein